ncbi:MAG: hypothetical protein IJO88_08990 [Oscillospiraceae bacterium]|nr:hypothetical protein [Oscillospiraceae bacterium]
MDTKMINAKVSQRIKLAKEDLDHNADLETVMGKLISQDRYMTQEETHSEMARIIELTKAAQSKLQKYKEKSVDELIAEIEQIEGLNEDLLGRWTVQAARELYRDLEHSGLSNIDRANLEVLRSEEAGVYVLSREEKIHLLAKVLRENGMTKLADGTMHIDAAGEQITEEELFENDELAVMALRELKKKGVLPDVWKDVPEEKLEKLIYYGRTGDMARMDTERMIRNLTDLMTRDTLVKFADVRAQAQNDLYEIPEGEMEQRQLLAVAAMLNLKQTGDLPCDWNDMSDEQLVDMVCCATELYRYYDGLSATDVDWEMMNNYVGILFMVALLTWTAAELLGTVGIVLGVVAAVFVALDFINTLLPAGIGETRIAISIKAKLIEAREAGRILLAMCKAGVDALLGRETVPEVTWEGASEAIYKDAYEVIEDSFGEDENEDEDEYEDEDEDEYVYA